MGLAKILLAAVNWRPSYRIIYEHPPDREIFAAVADEGDIDALLELERMTSARALRENEPEGLLRELDAVTGTGKNFVAAAFSYFKPGGSRFSDGSWGVYYCAEKLRTAVKETVFHTSEFLKRTQEPPCRLSMFVIMANLRGELFDLRNHQKTFPQYYRPADYAASQTFGREVMNEKGNGIAYSSVRDPDGGSCAAVFRPRVLSHARRERRLLYEWDGKTISTKEVRDFPA